ncbi:hypothetical protein Tery_2128 [Trichodesmium erythraeum IMS101]|uniref:Uncharacterized protein n=1 Tax=Trichodesmium erythraeum (strain IMS101) TaxID=203124 RepID=Q113G2_TRIEI
MLYQKFIKLLNIFTKSLQHQQVRKGILSINSSKKYLILKLTLVALGTAIFLTTLIKIEHSANSFSLELAEKIAQLRNAEKF